MELDLGEVIVLVAGYADRVRRRESELNALNVFPVADNDTGTNMVRTLDAISAALADLGDDSDLPAVAGAVTQAALYGRGNSGLILGQFLAGFTSVVDDERLGVAPGLAVAASRARAAVADPVEGTMLTLADAVAAVAAVDPDPVRLAAVAAAAVRATTGQLPALSDRGVVDAGAAGLALLFDALVDLDGGRPTSDLEQIVGTAGPSVATDLPELVGHELRFRVPVGVIDIDELRRLLSTFGSDVVVAASTTHLAAHLHVVDPNLAANAISAELEGSRRASAISYDVEPLLVRDRA